MSQPSQQLRHPAILALGTAVPPYSASQEVIGEWMAASFVGQPAVRRLIRSLYAYSGIETRYGCTTEYLEPPETSRFAPARPLDESPTTAERLAIYEREAPGLGSDAAHAALTSYATASKTSMDTLLSSITHLIVVSCTGFFAPGLDFMIASKLGLAPSTSRTVIGFMGCSAAFNALRMASQIVDGNTHARVLVVSVEICSPHIQPGTRRDDLVSASLFADGSAAALVGMPTASDHDYFVLESLLTDMKPDTSDEMVWRIGDHGFTLRLSPHIPDHLADVVPTALSRLTGSRTPDFWAIHPGGRAIVDGLQQILALDDSLVAISRRILCDFGNMSSATILFVLAAHARSLAHKGRPATGVAMAFGPGLTVEMALLSYVPSNTHIADENAAHNVALIASGTNR